MVKKPRRRSELADRVVAQRIAGRSEHAIAKDEHLSTAAVTAILDEFAAQTLNPELRKRALALELGRLDALQARFFTQAMNGDVAAGQLVEKLIARRCVMLGLHAPQEAVLRIIEESRPKVTSTSRIEAALNALCAQRDSAPVVEVEAHAEEAPPAS